jgi:hypothetical protein
MHQDSVADPKEKYQYQEECNMPTTIETMYYLFLCQGYSGEMED